LRKGGLVLGAGSPGHSLAQPAAQHHSTPRSKLQPPLNKPQAPPRFQRRLSVHPGLHRQLRLRRHQGGRKLVVQLGGDRGAAQHLQRTLRLRVRCPATACPVTQTRAARVCMCEVALCAQLVTCWFCCRLCCILCSPHAAPAAFPCGSRPPQRTWPRCSRYSSNPSQSPLHRA
jgi:hypothetical protein